MCPLLTKHAEALVVVCDEPGDWMKTRRSGPSGTRMTFGSLKTGADEVSLLFMPVYSHADLLDGVSDGLRERMVAAAPSASRPTRSRPSCSTSCRRSSTRGWIATAPTSSPDERYRAGRGIGWSDAFGGGGGGGGNVANDCGASVSRRLEASPA